MMQNDEIAKVLDDIGEMLELRGENFFRVCSYHNAARAIRDQPVVVAELSPDQIDQIPGIGIDLAGKIATLVKTGELPLHSELAARFPSERRALCDLPVWVPSESSF
jgi:DNA polymerase (family X)